MILSSPISQMACTKHTRDLGSHSQKVKNNNMKMAIKDAKKIASKNTKSNEIKISAGFDCSWNSPGYQAKDEIVPANSESTGNNVDVFHKI